MMQVSKKIPFEDPQVLMAVRVLYVVTNLIILGMYLYAQQKINKKKGMSFCDSWIQSEQRILTIHSFRYDNSKIC